ncbi:MAG: hypothetical protein ACFFD4_27855 [Candidatus Odinarchaeota archaeon]
MTGRAEVRLSENEKKVMNLFGQFYVMRGLHRGLGQIFAVLTLKTDSPQNGLDQQTIAEMIGRSVSTASRLLNKFVEMRYCDYTEELNEHKKRERKYYMTTSIKQIAVNRFHRIIREHTYLKNGLSKIRNDIAEEELSSNSTFVKQLELLSRQIDKLNEFFEKAIVLSNDFFDKL